MISLETQDGLHCFVVFQISVSLAREKVRYLLHCCLNQLIWALPGNSLSAFFSIELDR